MRQRAARRFATGGSPSGCRGRKATRSGCSFFRSSLQAWHRSTLASVCTGFSGGQTTSVKLIRLSWLHRRRRTSSSSQPPAIASAILGDGSAGPPMPHAPFLAGEPMRRPPWGCYGPTWSACCEACAAADHLQPNASNRADSCAGRTRINAASACRFDFAPRREA
jgi:hypothetical protein